MRTMLMHLLMQKLLYRAELSVGLWEQQQAPHPSRSGRHRAQ